MMNLILTLLTLAGGFVVGSAATFLSKKQLSISTVIGWGGILILLVGTIAFGIWAEHQIHPNNLFKLLSIAMTLAIIFYGIFCSIAWYHREELFDTLKDPSQKIWITAAATELWLTLTPIFWLIFLIFQLLDSYTALAAAIGLGLIILTSFYLILNFSWWLKYKICSKKEATN